jgi:hypothetical protein
MSKLVDAEALIVALGIDLPGYRLSDKGFDLKRTIQSQPDASEPLRKRIAELEDSLRDLAVYVRSLDITEQTHDLGDCEVLSDLLDTAEALLKGAQDA